MTIKKRSNFTPDSKAIESLATELADKPYGQNHEILVRTTLTLPSTILIKLEDMARNNKRNKKELKSVSAIIRSCIETHLKV